MMKMNHLVNSIYLAITAFTAQPASLSRALAVCRPPDKNVLLNFFYFSTKTYVVGTQKNRLIETVLLSTQKTYINWWIRK